MPQNKVYEYKFVTINSATDPECLMRCGIEGWRVVAGTVFPSGSEWRVICEREQ